MMRTCCAAGLETVLQQATYSVGVKGIKDPAQV